MFVCKLSRVWAVAWLLPFQVSRFTFRSRGFHKLLLQLAYVFQNIKNFTGSSYFNSTLFTIALQKSLSLLFVCLKIYTCSIRGFSCSLALSKSSLFRLHLDRKIFQKPSKTWVTFSQIWSLNIKPHSYCIKLSKARNEKG